MFSWMYWIVPTAIFFGVILILLLGMTAWEVISPTTERRGYIIPMKTTRGDRLFISLLASAYVLVVWVGWVPLTAYWVIPISIVLIAVLIGWG